MHPYSLLCFKNQESRVSQAVMSADPEQFEKKIFFLRFLHPTNPLEFGTLSASPSTPVYFSFPKARISRKSEKKNAREVQGYGQQKQHQSKSGSG